MNFDPAADAKMVGVSAHIVPRHRRWPLPLRSRPLTSHRGSSECHRREGELHPRRCWPMWRCRSSTSTSPRPPADHGRPQSSGGHGARRVCPTIGCSGYADDCLPRTLMEVFNSSMTYETWKGRGTSGHNVPSLSNTATHSSSGTNSGASALVTRSTNSMIDRFAAVSFQNDNADISPTELPPPARVVTALAPRRRYATDYARRRPLRVGQFAWSEFKYRGLEWLGHVLIVPRIGRRRLAL